MACFRCPVCQDNSLFRIEMSIIGIQIPDRLVSFCQAVQMRRREHRACPGSVSAGLALGRHRSSCLSFMEKLEMGLGWVRWDNLGSDAGDAGASSLSLPSLVGDQYGRTIVHLLHFYRGTGAVMPSCAFTMEAGSWQKKRGELPRQLSAAPWGISASAQAGGAKTEQQRCVGDSLAWLTWSSQPQPLYFPGPGS